MATVNRIYTTSLLVLALFFTLLSSAKGTTWSEPWHDEVLKKTDLFVLATVDSIIGDTVLKLNIERTLYGTHPSSSVDVDTFSMLSLCSMSGGHGPEFITGVGTKAYLFLQKTDRGTYALPTPTSAFALVNGDTVKATYRHSYHQAYVPKDVYETTSIELLKYLHGEPYSDSIFRALGDKYLALPSASFDKSEIDVFFMQHVALECLYIINSTAYCEQAIRFLQDTVNDHNQVSAARVLGACKSKQASDALWSVGSDEGQGDFLRAICLLSLTRTNPTHLKDELLEAQEDSSDEQVSFGGNIMDPRICTSLPSIRDGITDVIKALE